MCWRRLLRSSRLQNPKRGLLCSGIALGGFLCPVGYVNAFAEKINTLADSPTLRMQMGEYNRAGVERHFSIGRMINGYKTVFQGIGVT